MKETWSRAETFSVPMKRVPEMTYSCVRRKMRAEGRGPAREYSRNSRLITSMAVSGVRIIDNMLYCGSTIVETFIALTLSHFGDYLTIPESRKRIAKTLMSEVTWKHHTATH